MFTNRVLRKIFEPGVGVGVGGEVIAGVEKPT